MSDNPTQLLTEADLELIEQFAESMTPQEACDFFYMSYEELLPADREAFDRAYKKGRVNIRHFAMTKLKESCSGRNGMQSALAILSRFGEHWEHSEAVGSVKSFKVVLDD